MLLLITEEKDKAAVIGPWDRHSRGVDSSLHAEYKITWQQCAETARDDKLKVCRRSNNAVGFFASNDTLKAMLKSLQYTQ